MLKLSNTQRTWVILAIAAWIVALVGLIAIPLSRPAAAPGQTVVAPTNSLSTTLRDVQPNGGAVVAQLVSPELVYDTTQYAGYTFLCPNEPQELIDAKLEAFALAEQPDLDGGSGYVVLLPPDVDAPVALDQVDLKQIDICTTPHAETYPLQAGMPFFFTNGHWELGIRQ